MKLLISIFLCFFLAGCITIDPNGGTSQPIEDLPEPEPLRLTTEKIQYDEDGTAFIMVAFPKASVGHEFIEDNGEIVAVAILPKTE